MKNANKKDSYIPMVIYVIIAVILSSWLTKNMSSYASLIVAALVGLSIGYLYKIISEFIENKKNKK
jgi:ABC-type enterochelin transport system permease subunit